MSVKVISYVVHMSSAFSRHRRNLPLSVEATRNRQTCQPAAIAHNREAGTTIQRGSNYLVNYSLC